MEKLLQIVEKPSSSSVEIQEERLKFFASKIKIWDYAGLSQAEYQKLLLEYRSSILNECYCDLSLCFPIAGKKFFLIF